MLIFRVIFYVSLSSCLGGSSAFFLRDVLRAGRDVVKQSINVGASSVTKGLALGNSAVQTGASLVSSGAKAGATVRKVVVGGGVAVAGHTLALTSNLAVNTKGNVGSILQQIPVVGGAMNLGNERARQSISSLNKVGQAVLNGLDSVSDASLSIAQNATQLGARLVSKAARLGTAAGQTTVALGSSLLKTGVDNAFTLGGNIASQFRSREFNVSALRANLTSGAGWLLNDNAQEALTHLLPTLNSTFFSSLL